MKDFKLFDRLFWIVSILYAVMVSFMIVNSGSLYEAVLWGAVLWWFVCYFFLARLQVKTQKRVMECLTGWKNSLDGWAGAVEEFRKLKIEMDKLVKMGEPAPKPDTIMGKHGKRKIS